MSKIKEVYADGFAEINGRKYVFCDVNHKTRLKIFGFAQSKQRELATGQLSFVGTDEYFAIEDLMFKNMTFEDERLSKARDEKKHFEAFGEDYIILISTAMQVFSYPFMKGTS